MVVERVLATRAFAHRIVSVLEQRSGPRGVRGRVAGWEINADAEDAAEADERRVDRDVSERGAGVKRVIYRENSNGPTFGFLSLCSLILKCISDRKKMRILLNHHLFVNAMREKHLHPIINYVLVLLFLQALVLCARVFITKRVSCSIRWTA